MIRSALVTVLALLATHVSSQSLPNLEAVLATLKTEVHRNEVRKTLDAYDSFYSRSAEDAFNLLKSEKLGAGVTFMGFGADVQRSEFERKFESRKRDLRQSTSEEQRLQHKLTYACTDFPDAGVQLLIREHYAAVRKAIEARVSERKFFTLTPREQSDRAFSVEISWPRGITEAAFLITEVRLDAKVYDAWTASRVHSGVRLDLPWPAGSNGDPVGSVMVGVTLSVGPQTCWIDNTTVQRHPAGPPELLAELRNLREEVNELKTKKPCACSTPAPTASVVEVSEFRLAKQIAPAAYFYPAVFRISGPETLVPANADAWARPSWPGPDIRPQLVWRPSKGVYAVIGKLHASGRAGLRITCNGRLYASVGSGLLTRIVVTDGSKEFGFVSGQGKGSELNDAAHDTWLQVVRLR